MIHYRVFTKTLNSKIFYSFASAKSQGGLVFAYANKQSAINNQNALIVKEEPSLITSEMIRSFVKDMNEMRRIHHRYMNSLGQKYMDFIGQNEVEPMHDIVLKGFDQHGRLIDATSTFDKDSHFGPKVIILLNGKGSNKDELTKFI